MSAENLTVKTVVFGNGERFPILLDQLTGTPDFDVTLFVLTQVRARNLSASTMTAVSRAIMAGLQVQTVLRIDLDERLRKGQIYELWEVDALVDKMGWTQESIRETMAEPIEHKSSKRSVIKVTSIRQGAPKVVERQINASTKAMRLQYFRNYVLWKSNRRLHKFKTESTEYQALLHAKDIFVEAINARLPKIPSYNDLDAPQGISKEDADQLLKLVAFEGEGNPWKSRFVQARNQLIINLLLNLGIRKGELLGIRIADINFVENKITIHRSADDIEDPRVHQPNAKTEARELDLSSNLCVQLHEYIMKFRRQIRGAKNHPFLLVANGTGSPMSISAIDAVFREIKGVKKNLEKLSPHLLRHTWNDRFSEQMDEIGMDELKEEDARSFFMGWKSGSKTAKTYTRRHIKKKANELSLAMQSKFLKQDK